MKGGCHADTSDCIIRVHWAWYVRCDWWSGTAVQLLYTTGLSHGRLETGSTEPHGLQQKKKSGKRMLISPISLKNGGKENRFRRNRVWWSDTKRKAEWLQRW